MSEYKDIAAAPERVMHSDMRRHWWIAWCWESVIEMASDEPTYLRTYRRPIEQAEEAARQWDISHRAYFGESEKSAV
jgi:hypothetical protein